MPGDSNYLSKTRNSWTRGFAVAGRYILARSVYHVVRSGDEGETWQTIHNGLPDSIASSLVAMGDKVFLGNGHGVYRSLDQGGLWTKSFQNFHWPREAEAPGKGLRR